MSKLSEGGMGVVYRAQDTKLKHPAALKFLASHLIGAAEEKERFIFREAQAAATLDHPNICVIHSIHGERGEVFLAYIDGPIFADKVRASPLALDETLDAAIQMGEDLQAAREKGIVHRDKGEVAKARTLLGEAVELYGQTGMSQHVPMAEATLK